MNYLFFDIECANTFEGKGKICEFGYTFTDESFRVKEKQMFLINPMSSFDWYVEKNLLAYSKKAYYSSDPFPQFYSKIKKLLNDESTIVVGHTVDLDSKYLNDECRRYNMPFFTYSFYDAKEMYKEYANSKLDVGLKKMSEKLESNEPKIAHRSLDDAIATMDAIKAMCESMETDLIGLISLCPNCKGTTKDGVVKTMSNGQSTDNKRKVEDCITRNCVDKGIMKKYLHYRNGIQVIDCSNSVLNGKKVCFSRTFEDSHLKEMIFLMQQLSKRGAKCVGKASECDIFVKENGPLLDNSCSRLKAVLKEISNGHDIRIYTLSYFLNLMGLTDEDMSNAQIDVYDLLIV